MAARLPFESAVATGRGDDGTTGLLFGGDRVSKDDPRTEAYGTIDEAVAALGLARAELALKAQYGTLSAGFAGLPELVLRIQRELFVAAAELATAPETRDRLVPGRTSVSAEMVAGIEQVLRDVEARITMPREFVVPGETRTSAALELARATLRRAERRTVTLWRQGGLSSEYLLPYLNRLADLLWILARQAEQAESHDATPSRTDRPPRATRRPAPVATSQESIE